MASRDVGKRWAQHDEMVIRLVSLINVEPDNWVKRSCLRPKTHGSLTHNTHIAKGGVPLEASILTLTL
jgi:hypothetical protein